jgi:hypothetical protein
MATSQKKLTVENVTAGLLEFNGNLAAVARAHGVNHSSVTRFIQRHPSLEEVKVDAKESMKDNAE